MYIERGDIVRIAYPYWDSQYYYVTDISDNLICIGDVLSPYSWFYYEHFEVVTNMFTSS
jgi:hypothetical protein